MVDPPRGTIQRQEMKRGKYRCYLPTWLLASETGIEPNRTAEYTALRRKKLVGRSRDVLVLAGTDGLGLLRHEIGLRQNGCSVYTTVRDDNTPDM